MSENPLVSPVPNVDYDEEFYGEHADKARSSAEVIVPLVLELVAPNSVVDLGCGLGTWLAVFARHGVENYLGVDGEWVSKEWLEIPADRFVPARLDARLELDRRFDLAVSLEVAEHLPESAAAGFVKTLVRLAPCVLFSAAIPHQGGGHHVNEQWPEYWADLFARHGYEVVDAIRHHVWRTPNISFWYRQNTLLFATPEVLAAHPSLARERERTERSMLSVVHPSLLVRTAVEPMQHQRRMTAREQSLREIVYALPYVVGRSVAWRLRRL